MKIVFVQPNVGFKGHTWEALGIGYLSAYLKKYYPGELDIKFYSGFYDSDEQIIQGTKLADIIGFGCTSPQFKHAVDLAKQIKRNDNHIVFGGVHPSSLPELVMEEKCIDSVVIGEGEAAMLKLVQDVSHWGADQFYNFPFIEDLDTLPFPDRMVIKNERNIQQAVSDGGPRITSMLATRGCPFQCSFCCSHSLWGRKIRFRSPANLVDEMEHLATAWKIEFIKFADDTFTVDKRRIIEFCKLKIERGLKVPFGANAHIKTIDEEMLQHLATSGCRELWYGVESGSPRILEQMHKNTDIKRTKAVFALTKRYGIKTRAYFLLGLPDETLEDIEMTERLCDELQPDIVGFTLLAPYPVNQYFDKTMLAWDWSQFDEYNNTWVNTKTVSNADLRAIQHRLAAKYKDTASFRCRSV